MRGKLGIISQTPEPRAALQTGQPEFSTVAQAQWQVVATAKLKAGHRQAVTPKDEGALTVVPQVAERDRR